MILLVLINVASVIYGLSSKNIRKATIAMLIAALAGFALEIQLECVWGTCVYIIGIFGAVFATILECPTE